MLFEVYKKVLFNLYIDVLLYMIDLKLFMDFFIDFYNIGGVISFLVFNSFFVFIYLYNLDYFDFFKKFYVLFELNIFYLKY